MPNEFFIYNRYNTNNIIKNNNYEYSKFSNYENQNKDGQHSKYAANRRNGRIEIRNDNHHDCRGNNDNAQ